MSENLKPVLVEPVPMASAFRDHLLANGRQLSTAYQYALRVERALCAAVAARTLAGVEPYLAALPLSSQMQGRTAWGAFLAFAQYQGWPFPVPMMTALGRPAAIYHSQANLIAAYIEGMACRKLKDTNWWGTSQYTWGALKGWKTSPLHLGDPAKWPFRSIGQVIHELAKWEWGWPRNAVPPDAPIFAPEPRSMVHLRLRELRSIVRSVGLDFNRLAVGQQQHYITTPPELKDVFVAHAEAEMLHECGQPAPGYKPWVPPPDWSPSSSSTGGTNANVGPGGSSSVLPGTSAPFEPGG